jgi:hypothetical protein
MEELTRDQVNEVMRKHNDDWPPDADFSATDVREYAKYLRYAASDDHYVDNMVQAAELDLLVDKAEEGTVPTE